MKISNNPIPSCIFIEFQSCASSSKGDSIHLQGNEQQVSPGAPFIVVQGVELQGAPFTCIHYRFYSYYDKYQISGRTAS